MTEASLRFASSVKQICTRPTKNEMVVGDLIKMLYGEIERLKQQLAQGEPDIKHEVRERIATNAALSQALDEDWEAQTMESKGLRAARRTTLYKLGLDEPSDVKDTAEAA